MEKYIVQYRITLATDLEIKAANADEALALAAKMADGLDINELYFDADDYEIIDIQKVYAGREEI